MSYLAIYYLCKTGMGEIAILLSEVNKMKIYNIFGKLAHFAKLVCFELCLITLK